jgi:quercetin dioxygenase-like cupin family protein
MMTPPVRPSTKPHTTIVVHGADTGGRVALLETVEVRGMEPPCHQHQWEDEVLYVVAGELAVCVGGTWTPAPRGTTVLIPRGAEHGYAVLSDTARIVTTFAPAGFEGFYQAADAGGVWAATTPLAIERLLAKAAHYGCAITGPRPGPPPPPANED